jgi:hypothetical protein
MRRWTYKKHQGLLIHVKSRPLKQKNPVVPFSPDIDTAQHAHAQKKTSAVVKPSEAEKGVSRVFPDIDTAQLAHALKKPSEATTPSAAKRGIP